MIMTTNNDDEMSDAEYEWYWGKSKIQWQKETALKQVQYFSRQVGLASLVPKVIFDISELDEAMKELVKKYEDVEAWRDTCFGLYIPKIHTIYLNLAVFGTRPGSQGFIADVVMTVVHELVHARFLMIPLHGKEFRKRVNQVLLLDAKRIRSVHHLPTPAGIAERKWKNRMLQRWRREWRQQQKKKTEDTDEEEEERSKK
jgi:hypothetical protein